MTQHSKTNPLRELPAIEEVLAHPAVAALGEAVPRPFLVDAAREAVDQARKRILAAPEDERQAKPLSEIATTAACLALAL